MEADGQRRARGPRREVAEREAPATNRDLSFPKSVRILRTSDFRKVYDQGVRVSGPYFAAFCLKVNEGEGPKVGFTVPRALGKAVVRNRIKRRVREAVRQRLHLLGDRWLVVNPRRAVLEAPFDDLTREVERLFARCNG